MNHHLAAYEQTLIDGVTPEMMESVKPPPVAPSAPRYSQAQLEKMAHTGMQYDKYVLPWLRTWGMVDQPIKEMNVDLADWTRKELVRVTHCLLAVAVRIRDHYRRFDEQEALGGQVWTPLHSRIERLVSMFVMVQKLRRRVQHWEIAEGLVTIDAGGEQDLTLVECDRIVVRIERKLDGHFVDFLFDGLLPP
jgi:hypothetical protein